MTLDCQEFLNRFLVEELSPLRPWPWFEIGFIISENRVDTTFLL